MRKVDREKNGMDFPKLYYPELYLLSGGYKAFYNKYAVSYVYELPVVVASEFTHCMSSHTCMHTISSV